MASVAMVFAVLVSVFPDGDKPVRNQGKPICGILSMVVAAKAIGRNVEPDRFLDSKYVSDPQGSTVGDLKSIARQLDLDLQMIVFPDNCFFENIDKPVLLNLAYRTDAKCLGHWVTFLGISDGKWKIFDSVRTPSIQLVNPADILVRSRGIALTVSATNENKSRLNEIINGHMLKISIAAFLLLTISLIVFFLKSVLESLVVQMAALLSTMILACGVCVLVCPHNPVVEKPNALWMTITPSNTVKLPRVPIGKAFKPRKDQFFVDARLTHSRSLVLDNEIRIGVELPIEEVRSRITHVDRNSELIVFCQSESCGWADLVGTRLKALGFNDVSVLDGGVNRYREAAMIQGAYHE